MKIVQHNVDDFQQLAINVDSIKKLTINACIYYKTNKGVQY